MTEVTCFYDHTERVHQARPTLIDDAKILELYLYNMTAEIVENPFIMWGEPTIKGTRITAQQISGMHKGGDSVEFLAELYAISVEQVQAAIDYLGT